MSLVRVKCQENGLLSIDMKTKVVQHVPKITIRHLIYDSITSMTTVQTITFYTVTDIFGSQLLSKTFGILRRATVSELNLDISELVCYISISSTMNSSLF